MSDRQTARKLAQIIGESVFDGHSYDPKRNAQQNLSGRTHYADDDTLRFHKSRINDCRAHFGGLVLTIRETCAEDWNNTRRGHRFVAFNLFGDVINDRLGLDQMHKTAAQAEKAQSDWLAGFDVLAHYRQKLAERAQMLERQAADMRAAVSQLSEAADNAPA